MKMMHTRTETWPEICGTICDRCGAREWAPPEYAHIGEVFTDAAPEPRLSTYVTVTIDQGPVGDFLRGHFCPDCDQILRTEVGAWAPHLQRVSAIREVERCRVYRFPLEDAESGHIHWVELFRPDDRY